MSSDDPLATPVQFVPGVGPARAELFAKLGLHTVSDLLWNLPRDVLDLSVVRPAAALEEGLVQTVRGRVVDRDARTTSSGKTLVAVLLDVGDGYVRGVWFNQPWMLRKFDDPRPVLFSGKPKKSGGRWEFANPRVQWLDEDTADDAHGGILPRYRLTDGLRMDDLRRAIRSAVERYADLVPDPLPGAFRERLELPGLSQAIRSLHAPQTVEQYEAARKRLLFDDLFEFQTAVALRRRAWSKTQRAPKLECTAKIDARIRRLFPFRFTAGQDEAVRDVVRDLASGRAMHRLLQADVGAGKTAVALYAMLVAVAAGYQAVLMAPTEVLASQHWRTVERTLSESRVVRVLLTGQLAAKERAAALAGLADGSIALVVGTQAVIQQDVRFARLGLAVIDEQHKFGVRQRARFASGESSPHILVMTATPIPRSLCLTQFGDLSLTSIRDLPPGRLPVVTSRAHGPRGQAKAWDFVRRQLRAGRQAFVVCPKISESDADEADDALLPFDAPSGAANGSGPARRTSSPIASAAPDDRAPRNTGDPQDAPGPHVAALPSGAAEVFERLRTHELADFRTGLVHGRQDRDERARIMQAFRDGQLGVLVATTVIEVGVDVPNATLMVVVQAQRFGLSQLTSSAAGSVAAPTRGTACCSRTVARRTTIPARGGSRRWSAGPTASASRRRTSPCAGRATCSGRGSRARCRSAWRTWSPTGTCSKRCRRSPPRWSTPARSTRPSSLR
jgi:ATP-dependent DNA helicase RecG